MSPRYKAKQNETDSGVPKVVLSVNYGDVTAYVTADDEYYKAQIVGKIARVDEWQFNAFIINFINSIQKATGRA